MASVDLCSESAKKIDYLIHFRKAKRHSTLDSMYEAMESKLKAHNLPEHVVVDCYLAYGKRQDEIDKEAMYI